VFILGFALGTQLTIINALVDTAPSPQNRDDPAFTSLWETYDLISDLYVDPVETDVLVNGAISGMVDALDDQYSGYMDPELYPHFDSDLAGDLEGIGAVIRLIEDTNEIEIVNVLKDTPAMRAGLKSGDIFVEVNGEVVDDLNTTELSIKVRGPAGTEVNLTMRRGDELLEFTIVRAHIEIPNVEYELFEDQIGYIQLSQFNALARGQIDDALTDLDPAHLNGLIIDFRDNPGGLLSSAIDVASAFIEDGVILYEDFGDGNETTYRATGEFSGVTAPLVVLVNESSASASELVAGALQDRGLATIIGETTLGKGTVQQIHDLSNGGGLRLTIARWLTPNRNWIHEVGVEPDIVVEWTPEDYDDPEDPQLDAALDFFKSQVVENAQ